MASSKSTAPSRLPDLVTDSDSGADDGPCDAESSSDEEPSLVSLVRLALIALQGAKGKGKGTSIGKGKRQDKDVGNAEEKVHPHVD